MIAAAPAVDARAVHEALREVADPEIPAVSIVDLGIVDRIDVRPDGIVVEILPTFVGCPALELIREAVAERLGAFGRPVRVDVSFAVPWTSDRISPEGRRRLRASGFAPPARLADSAPRPAATTPAGGLSDRRQLPMVDPVLAIEAAPVACPFCGSGETRLENVFGPTQCRSIRYCAACRQPFEAFKPV